MAKKKKALAEGGEPTKVAGKVVRTDAELKSRYGNDGRVMILAGVALKLGAMNDFSGTTEAGKLKGKGSINGLTYRLKKDNGLILTASESVRDGLVSAAKSAAPDVAQGSYTGAVQEFLDKIFALKRTGGGGGRKGTNFGRVADLF